jgi:hypothetical protein
MIAYGAGDLVHLAVLALAAWRLAVALYMEGGLWLRLRLLAQRRGGFWQEQLSCFWCCTSWAAGLVWALGRALPLVAGGGWAWEYLLEVPALSAAALLASHAGRAVWSEMREGGG